MPNLAGSGLPRPQSYDTSDPAVVLDRVTGLSWQRVLDPGVYYQHPARSYCEALTLAGHHDWRLPSMIELSSITDTSRKDPAADPLAFANTPSVFFWSSQTDSTNHGLGWYVSFMTGGTYVGNDVQRFARARCVRGPPSCTDLEGSAFSLEGDIAHDKYTELNWRRAVEHDNYTWEDAKSFCATLKASGGGWRLPSLRELLTLVDVTHFEPATDALAFPNTPTELFWSSSPSLSPAGTAWGVKFTRGSSAAATVDTKAHVRCTR